MEKRNIVEKDRTPAFGKLAEYELDLDDLPFDPAGRPMDVHKKPRKLRDTADD